ncbi:TIGR04255 family protein [Nostoc sp.]|uniref:TIGR04255 family protein n=1 Tax=Nostoc sp. TaxID=1180 RepID=UPI002FFBE04D
MTRRDYLNPPIEEAVCEFRFAPSTEWNLTVPGLVYEKIRDSYPGEPRQQNLIAAEILAGKMPTNPEVTAKMSFTKLLFSSVDTKRLVGVGPDLLSVHSLRPYEGWGDFKKRIDQALKAYLEVSKPVGVTRIALRYINRIVIPSVESVEIYDYFTAYPQIPDGIPSHMSGFLTRTESIYDDIPVKLVIILADTEAPKGQIVFMLDLDVSQDWTEKSLSLEEAVSSLHELKEREGRVFETLITDRTRELFDVK